MSVIYAIDPGPKQSAIVRMDANGVHGGVWENNHLLLQLRGNLAWQDGILVIEQIESMGMAVGAETFETVFWSGRFAEGWDRRERPWTRVTRRAVKLHLCGSMRAKDPNIRQALIDKYGGVLSTKKGGALYGIKTHLWAALAVGVTYRETLGRGRVHQASAS